ncbi:MAG: class I SAM-dependent RNA methyltransferase [Treponema sp.]
MFYVIETTKYVFSGASLGLLNGKVTFVPFSLPNERIKIEIQNEKKNYINAKIVEVLEPSPFRCIPYCKYFYRCGGCNMQMAKDEVQRQLRLQSIKDTFFKFHIDSSIEVVFDKDWEYRARFQFHIHKKKLSLLGQKSSNFIPITDCPVACKEIRAWLKTSPSFDDVEGNRLHVFACDGRVFTDLKDENVSLKMMNKDFLFSPKGFFQSNLGMLEKLIEILGNHIKEGDMLLDFYSGIGTFSLFFADRFSEVHLVEHNKYSMEMAKKNFELNGYKNIKTFFHAISSENWKHLKASKLFYDIAIVDPPRTGIDKTSIQWFCKRYAKKIFYVSCDPVTFSRDAFVLINQGGYKLEKYYLLDFYPQTHHVESLGIFTL